MSTNYVCVCVCGGGREQLKGSHKLRGKKKITFMFHHQTQWKLRVKNDLGTLFFFFFLLAAPGNKAGSDDRHPRCKSTKARPNKGTKDQYKTDVKGCGLLSLELHWCN